MDRRHTPAAVMAALTLPAAAQQSPPQQLAVMQAKLLTLQDRLASLEQWRAGVEAAWPQILWGN